ncbi:MAG: hypothetical protein QOJ29_3600 [Thermoleophilaceae bacterium]|nr:hypothetical protein [Thermoleophilaceae bacterium]
MPYIVEPQTGHDLERLITALLNATGAVHQVIATIANRPAADGVEAMSMVADRLRSILAPVAEHTSDAELALATRLLAETTLLVVDELGLFRGRCPNSASADASGG